MADTGWRRNKYGGLFNINEVKNKKVDTNKYMNELIRNQVIRAKGNDVQYTQYDDDEQSFIQNNPDVVLDQTDEIIKEWTSDYGGYRSNYGIQKYLTEDRDLYGIHSGWEQGVNDIENKIVGTLKEPITTYRTVQIPVKQLNIGDIVDEKGFIPTSINRNHSVAAFNYGDSRSSTINIEVEPNTRCLYIGSKTGHTDPDTGKPKNEYELLFSQQYQIQIVDKQIEYDADGDYSRTIFKGKMIKRS